MGEDASRLSPFLFWEKSLSFASVLTTSKVKKEKEDIMSEAELARAVGSSPQAFNQRMKTGKFSTEEMDKIAEVLEAEYYFGFQFKDGTKI